MTTTSTSRSRIPCPSCGREFRSLTTQHIRTHGFGDAESFKRHFGLMYLKCEDMRSKQAAFMRDAAPTAGGHRAESIALMRANRAGKGVGVAGKYERTQEVRQRISEGVSKAYREGRCRWGGVRVFPDKVASPFWVRSSWEERVVAVLDLHPSVEWFEYEPFSLPYDFMGGTKQYTPDFLVHLEGGITEVWEVKPEVLTTTPKNDAKRRALNVYCSQHGFNARLVVMTDILGMEMQVGLRPWVGEGAPWVDPEDEGYRPTSPSAQRGFRDVP